MIPRLLRPTARCRAIRSDFSGLLRVTSLKSDTEQFRVPGVDARKKRIPICFLYQKLFYTKEYTLFAFLSKKARYESFTLLGVSCYF